MTNEQNGKEDRARVLQAKCDEAVALAGAGVKSAYRQVERHGSVPRGWVRRSLMDDVVVYVFGAQDDKAITALLDSEGWPGD